MRAPYMMRRQDVAALVVGAEQVVRAAALASRPAA